MQFLIAFHPQDSPFFGGAAAEKDLVRLPYKIIGLKNKSMKNILLPLVLLLSLPIFSQQQSVQNFYKKYMEFENVTNVSLSGWVLSMAAEYVDESKEKEMLSKITKLRVMVMEDGNLVTKNDYQDLLKDIRKDDFELFMNLKEDGQKIDFYLREQDDTITNVLLLVNSNDEFVLLSLEGNLKFSDINDLNFDIEGTDFFKKVPEKRKVPPRA